MNKPAVWSDPSRTLKVLFHLGKPFYSSMEDTTMECLSNQHGKLSTVGFSFAKIWIVMEKFFFFFFNPGQIHLEPEYPLPCPS